MAITGTPGEDIATIRGTISLADSVDGRLGMPSITGNISVIESVRGTLSLPSTVDGTKDYEKLKNKPSIESVTLLGNKTFEDLGMVRCTNSEIEALFANA